MTTVRGYPASSVRGDAGIMLSNELRFSADGVGRFLGHDFGDRFQPYLFIDYAAVSARQAAGLPASDGTLTSFGPGVRIELDRYATLEFDLGGQLRVGGDRRYPGQFFNVSINLRY
jgi:hemolysin activation/secretion protein